jgi:hypothetical protein
MDRKRAQLVVSLVIAMSFWSKDSMRDVLKNRWRWDVRGMGKSW